MLNRKFIINADFKGESLEDGLVINVQVRENLKAMILKAFISAIVLKTVRHMVNGILKDIDNTSLKLKKGRKFNVEA